MKPRLLLATALVSIGLSDIAVAQSALSNLLPKSIFRFDEKDMFTNRNNQFEEIILEKNDKEVKIRRDSNGTNSLTIFDVQLRQMDTGMFKYKGGACTGVPKKLEVGATEKYSGLFSKFNAVTKANEEQQFSCKSTVLRSGSQSLGAAQVEFFEIENLGQWRLPDGNVINFGISGKFAPIVGYWIEKRLVESRNGTVYRDYLSTLKGFTRPQQDQIEPL